MSYGAKDLRVNRLEAETVYVSKRYPMYTWDARPFDGSVNLMQYILRLERRIEILEKQQALIAPKGQAEPQENEIVQVEGAVPETS